MYSHSPPGAGLTIAQGPGGGTPSQSPHFLTYKIGLQYILFSGRDVGIFCESVHLFQ